MNKGFIKFIIFLIVTIIFIYAFSASYSVNNIDNTDFVTALGIDLGEDDDTIKVTFEFMDISSFSSDGSSEDSEPIINTITSTSINSAINLLNSYIGKEANLSHCKVVIFSQELAQIGIESEITELMNNIQIRPTANLIISKCSASEYIENSTSILEKVLTKYYDIFPNSSEYTGYTSNIIIGDFYEYLIDENFGNLAILGGLNESSESEADSSNESNSNSDSSSNITSESDSSSDEDGSYSPISIVAGNSSIEGERGTENIGLAVFNQDQYIGELTAMETLCHTLISGEVDSFLLTIDNEDFYEEYIELTLFQDSSPEICIEISDNIPTININLNLTGRIVGTKSTDNLEINLNEVSNAVNEILKSYVLDYLDKTQTVFKCDLDYFGNYVKCKFLTTEEWNDFNWSEKYLESVFDITINSDISYSLLNSE